MTVETLQSTILSPSQRDCLVQEPEAGMGYQLVEAELDGEWKRGIVINCELLITGSAEEDYPQLLRNAAAFYKDAEKGVSHQPVPLRLLYPSPRLGPPVLQNTNRSASPAISSGRPRAAIESPEEQTMEGQRFVRFSAFKNDFRVTADGGLVSGSFATTREDALNCLRQGEGIVARYALPNPELPRYAFSVDPPAQTSLKRGTVQPAYAQPGGGAEVLFSKGTAAGTVGLPHDISDGALDEDASRQKMDSAPGLSSRVGNGVPESSGPPQQRTRTTRRSGGKRPGNSIA